MSEFKENIMQIIMQLVLKYTTDCEFGTWITDVWVICMREKWQKRWRNAGREGPQVKSWNNKTKEKKGETESFSRYFHIHYFFLSPSPIPCRIVYSHQIFYRKIEALARWSKTLKVTQQISSRGRITTQAISHPADNSVSCLQSSQCAAKWKMKLYTTKQTEWNKGFQGEK